MLKQLNYLFSKGNEKKLRDTLYKEIKPLFPGSVTLTTTIEFQCRRGIDIETYMAQAQEGNMSFCGGCVEPTCCTMSDPVALLPDDIERIKKKGHRNFYKKYSMEGSDAKFVIRKSAPCQFLKDDRCTIYDYRPFVCRRYPMTVDHNTNKPLFYFSYGCNIGYNILKRQIVDSLRR
jgi:Uncharacterised protein family (UPF0153).